MMLKIQDIITYLETLTPSKYKEDYDNPGLVVGNSQLKLSGILLSLDITKDLLLEAKSKNCNLVICHHPLIFQPLKKINGNNHIEECIIYAIKNDIGIYAIHTNIDNILNGMSKSIAGLLSLSNIKILRSRNDTLKILTTFVPKENLENLKQSLFKIGCGNLGNYSNCSFTIDGEGTFLPNDEAKPYIGEKNKEQKAEEKRLELIFPTHLENNVIQELINNHPYEEVNYYIQNLNNKSKTIGAGAIGELEKEMNLNEFITFIKKKFNLKILKHTTEKNKKIKKVALCGGSGSFLINDALKSGADAFLTGDLKYHDYFYSLDGIILCDIGHYESEIIFKSILFKVLSNKFINIAIVKCETNTNPIQFS
ncbi:MAG: Nif3-like dinuclear metal center hexameric protein [Bacteroidetes bacterium]|nr:Nif3-like dinuclear metal center hexameric protein [Bacteroidota bacterium]